MLDTLQTVNADFAKNSEFCVHILCYMVLVMTNPIRCWDTKPLSCTRNIKIVKKLFVFKLTYFITRFAKNVHKGHFKKRQTFHA